MNLKEQGLSKTLLNQNPQSHRLGEFFKTGFQSGLKKG